MNIIKKIAAAVGIATAVVAGSVAVDVASPSEAQAAVVDVRVATTSPRGTTAQRADTNTWTAVYVGSLVRDIRAWKVPANTTATWRYVGEINNRRTTAVDRDIIIYPYADAVIVSIVTYRSTGGAF